jgi:glycosyltransferase involved in cell wall biosynthesis
MEMTSICFCAANPEWGASEFLWADAANAAATRPGIEVSACVNGSFLEVAAIRRLGSSGARIVVRPPEADEQAFETCEVPPEAARAVLHLRPDLVVISHGDNREGLAWMEFCAAHHLRYVSLAHRATESDWPDDAVAHRLRSAYLSACAAHFVSAHNRDLTEQTICARLPRAEIVRNPYNVSYAEELPWPADDGTLRMACVARLDLESKAQDVLFNVLAATKWRERPLHVDIVGREGPHTQLLRDLAGFLELRRVRFRDSVEKISSVWAECHALVLPSRKEGLPVAIVEAMLAGRPCLVTDVGGSAEIVEQGRSGWVAEGPYVKAMDRALELAWQSRAEWPSMGSFAARAVRSMVPADPAGTYADLLIQVLRETSPAIG